MTTRPEKPESVLESVLWFASSNFVRQMLGVVTAFLRPKLLSPELFGLFSLFRVLSLAAQNLHLGTRSAARYLGPQYRSRGDDDSNTVLQGTAFVTSIGLNAIVAIGLIGVGVLWPDLQSEARAGLYISAALIVISAAYDHFISALKAEQRFKAVSQSNMIYAVVLLVASVGLMLTLGFVGAMIAQVITVVVMIGVLAMRRMTSVTPHLKLDVLKNAIVLGGPTLLFNVFILAIRSVDRLIVAETLGLRELGFYALSGMVVGYVLNIPGATREVMEGKLFEQLDDLDSETVARTQVHHPVQRMAFVMTPFIGLTVIAVPFAIELILPEYAPGILAIQILTISSWFLCVSYPLRGVLVAFRRQAAAVGILVLSLAVHMGLTLALIRAGFGIRGPALSAGVAFGIVLSGHFLLAVTCTARVSGDIMRTIAVVAGTFALLLGLLFGVFALEPALPAHPLVRVVCQGAIFSAVMVLTLPLAQRLDLVPRGVIGKISGRLTRGRGSSQ